MCGCATGGRPAAAGQPPVAANQGDDSANEDLISEDLPGNPASSVTAGNPAALAHYAAGVSYEWNDQDDLAVRQFEDSALADPSNEHLVIRVAQRFLKNKQVDKAIDVLSKSAHRPAASGLLLSWLARAELQAGKTSQALSASRLSIQRQPDAFDGYESQIEILLHDNQLNEAARTLNRAAKSIRPDPPALVALGGLYMIYLKAQPKDDAAKAHPGAG